MIDRKTMRSLLENMERAAEETLQQDSSFYEALHALKTEIDNDAQVQATVSELRAAGGRVFNSFAPHIKIRVRTEEGIFALPRPAQEAVAASQASGDSHEVGRLTRELRNAASAVIRRSRNYRELDAIVNEAVGASDRFEAIASEIETQGHEILICLDLSAYALVSYAESEGTAMPSRQTSGMNAEIAGDEPFMIQLSRSDRKFLAGLKISVDAEPLGA
jgi:hypothetical protein